MNPRFSQSRPDFSGYHKSDSPEVVYQELKKQIQTLKRRQPSPYYRKAFQLAGEVSDIVQTARQDLFDSSPEMGWEIIDLLLRSDKKLLYSVDDSSGAVGGEFGYLPDVWIEFAEKCEQDKKFWLKKIERLIKEDEWGFRGEVLEKSVNLLGKDILKKSAEKFANQTQEAKDALAPGGGILEERPVWHIAGLWMSCAKALKDPFMYEQAMTAHYSREPVGQQLLDVIRFFIKTKHLDEAEDRLKKIKGSNTDSDCQKLFAEIYTATGNKEKLLRLAQTRFQQFPDCDNLNSLLQILPASERAKVKKQAVKIAMSDTETYRAVSLLLELGRRDAAEKMLIERQSELSNRAYPWALNLINELEEHDSIMGIIICYRALLLDILDRGFNKGYRHAANYYKTLKQVDSTGITYSQGIEDHSSFVENLKAKHGLKSSFWKRLQK